MSRFFATVLVLVVVFATACGGGGSSTGGIIDPSPVPTPVVASFSPAVSSPDAQTVSMSSGPASADVVTVRVNVTGVNDVFSVGFNLDFDPLSTQYIAPPVAGTVLEQGGYAVYYEANLTQPGTIYVLATRLGPVPGANVPGTGTVVNLNFRVLAKGTFALTFQNGALRDSAITQIPVNGWYAGSLIGS